MVGIIDYKAGNAPSVLSSVRHLGFEAELVREPGQLSVVDKIILPGVGSAGATMDSLRRMGLVPLLEKAVLKDKKPFLGVCVGLQVLFDRSEEDDAVCLGWLRGEVRRFGGRGLKVPQMGWNSVRFRKDTTASAQTREDYFYFVNSYRALPEDESVVWGVTDYGGEFASAVNSGNIYATQFHIEKSGPAGLMLLEGFLKNT